MKPSECTGNEQRMQSIRWLIALLYKLNISPDREIAQPLGSNKLILIKKVKVIGYYVDDGAGFVQR